MIKSWEEVIEMGGKGFVSCDCELHLHYAWCKHHYAWCKHAFTIAYKRGIIDYPLDISRTVAKLA